MKYSSQGLKAFLGFLFLGVVMASGYSQAADRPLIIQTMGHNETVNQVPDGLSGDNSPVTLSVVVVDSEDGSLVDVGASATSLPTGWDLQFVRVPTNFDCGINNIGISQFIRDAIGKYRILVEPTTCNWHLTDRNSTTASATEYHYVVSIEASNGADTLQGAGLGSLIFDPGLPFAP